VPEKAAGPFDDRQAEADTGAEAQVFGAREFLEDPGLVLLGNADAGVPDLEHDVPAAAPAADEDAAAGFGILDGVHDEVLDGTQEIDRIRAHEERRGHDVQRHGLAGRKQHLVGPHALHDGAEAHVARRDRIGIGALQPRDVQQRVQQLFRGRERALQPIDHGPELGVLRGFLQGGDQQLRRVDRLQQVVARCREKPGLGRDRRLGPFLGQPQLLLHPRLFLVLLGEAGIGAGQLRGALHHAIFKQLRRPRLQRHVLQFDEEPAIGIDHRHAEETGRLEELLELLQRRVIPHRVRRGDHHIVQLQVMGLEQQVAQAKDTDEFAA